MLCNPFLISTISTCPLEYQLKMAFFCFFHIIFTGSSLSWTRRVLCQARIRDVKYYINSELSPVLKGVFPQTTGCTLESGPSLHSRSNCFWGDIALALHTPRRLRHEKNNGSEGKGQDIFFSSASLPWTPQIDTGGRSLFIENIRGQAFWASKFNNLPPHHDPDAQPVTLALDLLGNWGQRYHQQYSRTWRVHCTWM